VWNRTNISTHQIIFARSPTQGCELKATWRHDQNKISLGTMLIPVAHLHLSPWDLSHQLLLVTNKAIQGQGHQLMAVRSRLYDMTIKSRTSPPGSETGGSPLRKLCGGRIRRGTLAGACQSDKGGPSGPASYWPPSGAPGCSSGQSPPRQYRWTLGER
jgi:hypothetical protein